MKKNHYSWISTAKLLWRSKPLKTMRLTLFAILVSVVQIFATNVHAQQTRLSLNLKNTSIRSVLGQIENQTDFYFIYNAKAIDVEKEVSIDVENESIPEILDKIFEGTNVFYKIDKRQIAISTNLAENAVQQEVTVSGRVTDSSGEPLPGVTVVLKGSTRGATTDTDGNYSLGNVPSDGMLVFSFIGMKTLVVPVSGKANINVILSEEAVGLEEVVAIGYGTQKKVNLTGAVGQVGEEVFENRSFPTAGRALQGALANLNIKMTDGKPIREPEFNIRGATSIGAGGSALVLVDGIPGNPNLINPNDIASVTILKDAASSAIYGARGAFGVVLITTKSPKKGSFRINYTGSYSINEKTVTPELVWDGYEWAKAFSEAFDSWNDYNKIPTSVNNVFPFSAGYLDELKSRHDNPGQTEYEVDENGRYIYYGNTNWYDLLYKPNNSGQNHSLNISGGSDKVSYYLSGNYFLQDGIFRYNSDDYSKYNLRSKGTIQAAEWLSISNNSEFNKVKYKYPLGSMLPTHGIWRAIADEAFPMALLQNPDGTLTNNSAYTVGDFYLGKSKSETLTTYFKNTSSFVASFFGDALKLKGDFTYAYTDEEETRILAKVPFSNYEGQIVEAGNDNLSLSNQKTNYYVVNVYSEFEKIFNNTHTIRALVGFNMEESSRKDLSVSRDGLVNYLLPDFSLTTGMNINLRGGGREWSTAGAFYRFNYDYKGKYLFEANGRYDGSSKFPEHQRFGFFPSVSVGWRLSEEDFLKNSISGLDNLKLRASYGSLGNGQVSPYQYSQSVSLTQSSYILGGILPQQYNSPNVIPDGLTWETSTTLNIGLDLGLFRNRFDMSFDWYERNTTGMYTVGTPLPATFGTSIPKGNYADLSTRGWELSLKWRDKFSLKNKPFLYDLTVLLSDNLSEITKYNNPTKLLGSHYVGETIGEIWGYETVGLFLTEEDIATSPDHSLVRYTNSFASPRIGDIKFADLDGDEKIDYGLNTYDDPGDRRVIGNSEPRYNFGLRGSANWNNLDLSFFFQGVGKRDWWPSNETSLFWGMYNRPYAILPKFQLDNMYTLDNPNTDAYFPRLTGYIALASQNASLGDNFTQTRYLQNAAYIRLKDITIGYTLPVRITQKLRLDHIRLFLNGTNLWTYSPMFRITRDIDPEVIEGSDPEIRTGRGDGNTYPMLKSFSFGVDVTF